jgi:hypothetical protein
MILLPRPVAPKGEDRLLRNPSVSRNSTLFARIGPRKKMIKNNDRFRPRTLFHPESIAIALGLFASACGGTEAKSIFALTASDFATHQSFGVAPDAITVQSSTLWSEGGGSIRHSGLHSGLSIAAASPQATGTTVDKGAVLLAEASGTITVDGMPFGPEGDAAIGGTSYPLVNRPVNALYGQIGGATFSIGKNTALLAPADGALELLTNTCSSCTVTGSFRVTLHSKLVPGVELATLPAITDDTVQSSSTVAVDASKGFAPTGIRVSRGQKVYIDASGAISVNGAQTLDANGDAAIGGTSYVLVNRRVYRLHARVGGTVLQLGTSSAFLSPSDGELELVVNGAGDATGMLMVKVGLGVVPAQGLIGVQSSPVLAQRKTVTVPPDAAWHGAGISVTRGAPLVFSATGQISGGDVGGTVGPYGGSSIGGTAYALVNSPTYALYGRVKDQVFFIGGDNALLAPASGAVELLINATTGCGGCTGKFDVSLAAP